MIKIRCQNCGTEQNRNILPGKHAVFGALTNANKTANCCKKPDYKNLEDKSSQKIDKNLRELVTV